MTRAEISGALQVLNAGNTKNRGSAIKAMLAPKFAPKVVDRILADLKSYPEWAARMDLEEATPATGAAPADPQDISRDKTKAKKPRPPSKKAGTK